MMEEAIFLSDTHLGARYLKKPLELERRVVRFLEAHSQTPNIFLLGDMIDFWWEYRTVVPKGFTRFFGALASLTDAGCRVTWLKGNHDTWTHGYLEQELGVHVVDESLTAHLAGHCIYMAHGDGVGRQPASYRMLRRIFRSEFARRFYCNFHPRWGVEIGRRWSGASREADDNHVSPAIGRLEDFCRAYLKKSPEIDTFVFGHLHTPYETRIGPETDARMFVLGDWLSAPGHFLSLTSDGIFTLRAE